MEGPMIPIWGPALWSIFHSLAAKSGRKMGVIIRGLSIESEEKRLWRSILLAFRSTIPCPTCQKHYNEYIAKGWPGVFEAKGSMWGEKLRNWFYVFHNAVRSSKGQPLDFKEEQLERYANSTKTDMIQWKQTLTEHMRRGLVLHLITRDDMVRVLRLIEELIMLIF
jgi:Erv1 / Alr family